MVLVCSFPGLFLPGFGGSGTVLLGLDLGQGFLILLVGGDVTILDLLHQLCRGAGLCHGIQQSGRQLLQNLLLAGAAAVQQCRDLQQPVSGILGDADGHAPRPEGIFSAIAVFRVVAQCDNSAQRIMGSGNGIAHVDKAALGHLLTVAVFVLGKVQVLHGLVGQAGIIKRRAHRIRHGG